jgi:proteasome regulatory subunit
MLDEAILRPGRFDRLIEVPKPDTAGRAHILDIHTREMSLAEDVDTAEIAADLDGYSGADIASLATEAGMFAIRDGRTAVTHADFVDAKRKLTEDDSVEIPGLDYQY